MVNSGVLVTQMIKRLPTMWVTRVRSLGREHPPGEGNGNLLQYSSLENPMDGGAWWAAVHGVAKSRTRLSDFTFILMHWRRKWQPTPVFLPGESQGQGSLGGCCLWGPTVRHDWSNLATVSTLIVLNYSLPSDSIHPRISHYTCCPFLCWPTRYSPGNPRLSST